jgi:RNA recognition motif-containing protein
MAVRLFIGNLPYDVTEAELRAHFAAIGPLSFIALPMDRDTGTPRGFAFIEFSARTDAEDAMRRLNNQLFKGRPLAVSAARAGRSCATQCPAPIGRGGHAPRHWPGLRPRGGATAAASAREAGCARRARTETPHL